MGIIIDGRAIAARIKSEVRHEVLSLKEKGISIGLAVIIVGDDAASKIYVKNKGKACDETGIYSEIIEFPEETDEETLLSKIDELNKRKDINGILVQLPVPAHINKEHVIEAISPEKDVDAFSDINTGKIMRGNFSLLPCTPAGIIELIKRSGIEICGKECVVIGRSDIVGKPMAMLLLHNSGTVTVCHSKTENLREVTKRADILVSAIGKADFIDASYVKPGAVVIDVGMNRREDGKLTGDVDFVSVSPVASFITPVPGGVGPMTIAMLMKNTLTAAKKQNNI